MSKEQFIKRFNSIIKNNKLTPEEIDDLYSILAEKKEINSALVKRYIWIIREDWDEKTEGGIIRTI